MVPYASNFCGIFLLPWKCQSDVHTMLSFTGHLHQLKLDPTEDSNDILTTGTTNQFLPGKRSVGTADEIYLLSSSAYSRTISQTFIGKFP